MLTLITTLHSLPTPDFGPNFIPSTAENMNGEYPFSTTPGGTPGLFPKHYRDYPGGVQSFDLYAGPMTTLYSQVWWSPLKPVELPPEIIKAYNGTGMAIVGWEIDQVRQTPDGDVSVPISASYNHHYVSRILGAGAKFTKAKLDGPSDPRAQKLIKQSGHGMIAYEQEQYLLEDTEGDDDPLISARSGLPSHQAFSSANGGEYRKTYHGFAPGYALVVDSPTSFQVTPMQIDSWNREKMDISKDGPKPVKFVAGPLPRASLAPKDAAHSGLLECPMTTRLTKVVDNSEYISRGEGNCIDVGDSIVTYQECYQAAAMTLSSNTTTRKYSFVNASGHDAHKPSGCTATITGSSSLVKVYFNEESTTIACTASIQCICTVNPKPFGQATGALLYHTTNQTADKGSGKADHFGGGGKRCNEWPSTTLLEQKNPTCDVRYYRGGQWACHHMWSLLDHDQQIPWTDKPLVFYHKYRFWVQPFKEDYHKPLTLGESVGSALLIGSPWEFDVPKCAEGIPGCSKRESDGLWIHTISGSTMGKHTFVALNNHCHAPTCLSMSIYACAKGTPLEKCDTTNGKLICETKPVYGGSGDPKLHGTRFDEEGYIAIPDCFWGDAEYGLEPPVDVDGVPIHIVKTANASTPHYGEMAGGQPWVLSSSV